MSLSMTRHAGRTAILLGLALVLPGAALAKKGKKKKKGEEEPPPVGWFQHLDEKNPENSWAHACYHPPDWSAVGEGEKKILRSQALDEMLSQWDGSRDDGVNLGEEVPITVETVLLGRPHQIEMVTARNLELCLESAKSGGSTGAWGSWLKGLPAKLTAGECPTPPLDYTMFDYLDIQTGWQRRLPICQGDKIRISGTVKDRYRISKDGPWINVEGETDVTAAGKELPCDLEGCHPGTLIMRYTTDQGIESIFPVNPTFTFEAPEHGHIEYRINDETFYDNTWYKSGSIIDHTAIEVSPAK